MKIYQQLFFILLFSLLGEALALVIPFPIPGSIIGMIALFACLQLGWIKLEQVETVGKFLTDNFAILFLPAGVGVMVFFPILSEYWWSLSLITVVSTVVTLGFVAWVVQRMVPQSGLTESEPGDDE